MSDNTQLNPVSTTEKARTVERVSGSGVKTQVVQLDQGASGGVENIVGIGAPLLVKDAELAQATVDNAYPTFLAGNPAGDMAGVDLMDQLTDTASGVGLNVNLIAPIALRDSQNALILSDCAPLSLIMASGQTYVIDTNGYQSVQLSAGTTFAASIAASNDKLNWISLAGTSPTPGVMSTTISANTAYSFPAVCRYIKITCTTAGSAVGFMRNAPWTGPVGVSAHLWGNGQTMPTINVVTATTPAVTVVKSSAGKLTMLNVGNGGTVAGCLHLYNATSVTLGTTPSAHVYPIPGAVGTYPIPLPDGGLYYSSGICYAFTGAMASTDNTTFGSAPALVANLAYI